MTARIDYQIQDDTVYLTQWWEHPDGSREFFGGRDHVVVPRGKPVPDSVRHAVTTIGLIEILDAILAEGIRPSSEAWSAAHVKALQSHIAFAERVADKLMERIKR
jgi:hypothetical protein